MNSATTLRVSSRSSSLLVAALAGRTVVAAVKAGFAAIGERKALLVFVQQLLTSSSMRAIRCFAFMVLVVNVYSCLCVIAGFFIVNLTAQPDRSCLVCIPTVRMRVFLLPTVFARNRFTHAAEAYKRYHGEVAPGSPTNTPP
jgi:hypothetical protein